MLIKGPESWRRRAGSTDRAGQDRHGDQGPDLLSRPSSPTASLRRRRYGRRGRARRPEHPLARAIAAAVDLELPRPRRPSPTRGARGGGRGRGQRVARGRSALMDDSGLRSRTSSRDASTRPRPPAARRWWPADGRPARVLVIGDALKPTSAQAVAALSALGLRPVLLTGDNEAPRGRSPAGRDRRSRRRGAARRQGRRGPSAAGARATGGDGRRRRQRRAGTGPPTSARHGHRHGRAIEAADITLLRGDLRAAADAIGLSAARPADDQAEPGLGVRLQRAAIPLARPDCSTR